MAAKKDKPPDEPSAPETVSFRVIKNFYRSNQSRLYKRGDVITVPVPGSKAYRKEFGCDTPSRAWVPLDQEVPAERDPTETGDEPRALSQIQHGRPAGRPPGA